jgi:hypothetical protein
MEPSLSFGLCLVLGVFYSTVAVIERKGSHGRRKVAESVPFFPPWFLGFVAWVFPGASRVILVLSILFLVWALSMMVAKWLRR